MHRLSTVAGYASSSSRRCSARIPSVPLASRSAA